MKALVSNEVNKKTITQLQEMELPQLKNGQVKIKAEYSSLNYKDALAVTGAGRIFKSYPMIGGIDVAGQIEETLSSKFKVGDKVLVTGCGLGETHNGGYAEYVIESEENVIPLPRDLTCKDAMIYGTAGFTAALCVERLLQNNQQTEMGPILVTGASGGVGQFAISFFSKLGFEVHAVSGKNEMQERLLAIGAKKIIHPNELLKQPKPLETVRYGGVIDNVGGEMLSNLISQVQLWGNIACVGLAGGAELQTTVMPLILRGVSLIGISSNNTPRPLREKIWQRLATDLKPNNLNSYISQTVSLDEVVPTANQMLSRKTSGRILVRI